MFLPLIAVALMTCAPAAVNQAVAPGKTSEVVLEESINSVDDSVKSLAAQIKDTRYDNILSKLETIEDSIGTQRGVSNFNTIGTTTGGGIGVSLIAWLAFELKKAKGGTTEPPTS